MAACRQLLLRLSCRPGLIPQQEAQLRRIFTDGKPEADAAARRVQEHNKLSHLRGNNVSCNYKPEDYLYTPREEFRFVVGVTCLWTNIHVLRDTQDVY